MSQYMSRSRFQNARNAPLHVHEVNQHHSHPIVDCWLCRSQLDEEEEFAAEVIASMNSDQYGAGKPSTRSANSDCFKFVIKQILENTPIELIATTPNLYDPEDADENQTKHYQPLDINSFTADITNITFSFIRWLSSEKLEELRIFMLLWCTFVDVSVAYITLQLFLDATKERSCDFADYATTQTKFNADVELASYTL